MARISEILAERKNKGFGIPERVAEVTGSAPGITEELYTNAVLDSLGGSYPWLTARLEKAEKPSIPSYKSILNLLDIEDEEGGRTALQQFVEDFPEKRAEWKKKALKKDSTLGEKGWKTIYDIWKQVSVDKMNSDIKEARKNALEGLDENGEIENFGQYAWSKAAKAFTPRRYKAFEEGREPTNLETAMDIGQNAAYMVPMGGAEAAIARGLLGSSAGKVAGAVGAAAIAPSVVTSGDYLLGTKDYSDKKDAFTDAAIGTATNLGVNKVIAPAISAVLNVGKVRGTIPQWLRKFLEDNSSEKQKAKDLVKEAEARIKLHNAETSEQYADKLRRGVTPDRLSEEQIQKYRDILDVGELSKNKEAVDEFSEGWKLMRDVSKFSKEKQPLENMIDNAFVDPNGAPESIKRAMVENPELISLMEKKGIKDYAKDPYTYTDVLKSYVVNEAGNDAAAQRTLSRFGIDPKDLRKDQDKKRMEKKAKASVSEIIGGSKGSLSPESKMFLQDIKEDPGIVVTGHKNPKLKDAFKIWLITEGNDLLRGTAASRPAWEVK
jgi:hypothetical protein